MEDPGQQFAWLSEQLKTAKRERRSVYIIGHIGPGIDHYLNIPTWLSRFQDTYLEIIDPYLNSVIKTQLFSHEHAGIFKLFARDVIFFNGAISPITGNNPMFRIYTFSHPSMDLIDWEEWYLPLSDQGGNQSRQAKEAEEWEQRYPSYTELFNLRSINFVSLQSFAEFHLRNPRSQDFLKYISEALGGVDSSSALTRFCSAPDPLASSSGRNLSYGNEECIVRTVCMTLSLADEEYTNCTSSLTFPPSSLFVLTLSQVLLCALASLLGIFNCAYRLPRDRAGHASL